jgi:hypothetical protein
MRNKDLFPRGLIGNLTLFKLSSSSQKSGKSRKLPVVYPPMFKIGYTYDALFYKDRQLFASEKLDFPHLCPYLFLSPIFCVCQPQKSQNQQCR